jgi:hypothetical protein
MSYIDNTHILTNTTVRSGYASHLKNYGRGRAIVRCVAIHD